MGEAMTGFSRFVIATLFGAALMSHAARAAEITVVSSTAMTEFLEAAIPVFERETGNKVKTTFLSSAVLPGKVKEGVQADLIVTTPGIFDDLVKVGKLVPGSRSDFIKSSAGVAVRAGAPKPDISTPEAFKRAMLGAKSVGHSKEGLSGVHFLATLDLGPELLRPPLAVLFDDRVGGREDRLRGAVVLLQHDHARIGEVPGELLDVADGGAAERVDGLVRVADHAQLGRRQRACVIIVGLPGGM